VDILDGTPVLDIKPYVAYTDSHPGAGAGWLNRPDPGAAWPVVFSPLAEAQAAWVEEHTGHALRTRIGATLALGPQPHPYRRIRRHGPLLHLAVKEWRIRCEVQGREIRVLDVTTGFRASQLARLEQDGEGCLAAHRAFVARWPGNRV
jgi:hypothetical protein